MDMDMDCDWLWIYPYILPFYPFKTLCLFVNLLFPIFYDNVQFYYAIVKGYAFFLILSDLILISVDI